MTAATQTMVDEAKARACIHCGLCLAACPTFLETGNENDSPRGRIYIMRGLQEGRLMLNTTSVRHMDLCLGCRACEAVCPSGVQYGDLLEHTRDYIEKKYPRPALQTLLRRVAIERVFPFPKRMRLVLTLQRFVPRPLMPRFLRDLMELLPEQWGSTLLPEFSPGKSPSPTPAGEGRGEESKRVGFISGCVQSVLFSDTNANSIKLLNRAGYDVITPSDQVCCGALYAHGGNLARARDCARHNIAVFERANVGQIIINAAGCGSTLKEYDKLLADDPAWREPAKTFCAKVKDLVEIISPSAFRLPPSSLKVTYHDACHLVHPQHITKQPRDLIRAVAGVNFVELPESDVCCGSAGSYNLTEPEMAGRLQRRKIQNILATGAQLVVTTNPGCLLQIRAGLKKAGVRSVRVLHIADFLEMHAAT